VATICKINRYVVLINTTGHRFTNGLTQNLNLRTHLRTYLKLEYILAQLYPTEL